MGLAQVWMHAGSLTAEPLFTENLIGDICVNGPATADVPRLGYSKGCYYMWADVGDYDNGASRRTRTHTSLVALKASNETKQP